jgi:hypothetical protein
VKSDNNTKNSMLLTPTTGADAKHEAKESLDGDEVMRRGMNRAAHKD